MEQFPLYMEQVHLWGESGKNNYLFTNGQNHITLEIEKKNRGSSHRIRAVPIA
jgi:hypothetical protein